MVILEEGELSENGFAITFEAGGVWILREP